MLTTLIVIAALAASLYIFLKTPRFGATPTGKRLERIKQSPNYRDGQFQNLSYTPQLADGATYFGVIKKFFFTKKVSNKPSRPLPSVKTDLKNLSPDENVVVWFGHSSYFIQVDGKKILVDPVFSGAASPVVFTTRSYLGSDIYTPDDFPEIDWLFLSHDHWDHLDYNTVSRLKSKVKMVITGLGTGAHLERWGFDAEKIIEKDWNETIKLDSRFTVYTTTARHFSGRGFKRNQALWMAFLLQTPTRKIYLGGDSGYDKHFAEIGKQFGPIDLAIMECGQYNPDWKYIHMLPHEIVPAAQELGAKMLLPVHWGKFSLSTHPWDEPINIVTEDAKKAGLPVLTPMIGEKVDLDNPQVFDQWWKNVDG
jgi:L-ascorbate metabolism protein UlaG (beta-lactamase superfamily)